MMGIDSIKLSKMTDGTYSLDFLQSGSYEEFEEKYKTEMTTRCFQHIAKRRLT